ncbi:hypothetical protein DFQ29_006317, partial [Apophysomyces sp. BC1021]
RPDMPLPTAKSHEEQWLPVVKQANAIRSATQTATMRAVMAIETAMNTTVATAIDDNLKDITNACAPTMTPVPSTSEELPCPSAPKPSINGLFRVYNDLLNGDAADDETQRVCKSKWRGEGLPHGIGSEEDVGGGFLGGHDKQITELAPSSICNLIAPDAFDELEGAFPLSTFRTLQTIDRPDAQGLTEIQLATLRTMIINDEGEPRDMDSLLTNIRKDEYYMCDKGERRSDMYIATKMLETIAQDLTVYRRIASLLDLVFRNIIVKLVDGEHASSATKDAKVLNQANGDLESSSPSSSSTYGRKIDLLTVVNLRQQRVEISASEWKRPNVTLGTAVKQQTKNLVTNASIISNLVMMNCSPTVLAMDWIGTAGYMYYMTYVHDLDMFVANVHTKLAIPTTINDMEKASDTINTFFKW